MSDKEQLERRAVVTAFLRHEDKVLLLRRSDRVGFYRGRWAGVSGYMEDLTSLEQALLEIREETGLPEEQVHLVGMGQPLEVPTLELSTLWVVHPFLFNVDDPDAIRLDWENTELRWVKPGELRRYDTVPALAEALESCLKKPGTG
jgi:8-oxo-dGTP pyrophosphatase MutT (NUDIX family)